MKRNTVAWAALVVALAALVGSHNFTRAVPAAQDIPAEGQKVAKSLSDAFGAVADFVKPSVVQINIHRKGLNILGGNRGNAPGNPKEMTPKDLEEFFKRFFGPDGPKFDRESFEQMAEGTGSGFLYDDKGHILTNDHVVREAEKITVTFYDGVEAPATVVGHDRDTDVAVLKVDNTTYRPLPRGNSKNLHVGEWVLAFGSPFGLSQTVTAGIISATERDNVAINRFESFIQTDASINMGNSGGPLVDMSGRVIGINSAIATGPMSRTNAGVGFTIPIDMAARRADKLIRDGKVNPGLIGVMVDPLTPALARQLGYSPKTHGLVVTEVTKESPAAAAGLKVGDVITTFDGNPVNSLKALQYFVQSSDIGKSYPLTYLRDNVEKKTSVAPAPFEKVASLFPDAKQPAERAAKPAETKQDVGDFGLAVEPATPELASKYGYPEDVKGLIVTQIKDESPADVAGLEVGDLITKVVKDKQIKAIQDAKVFNDLAHHSDELTIYVRDAKGTPPGFHTLSKPKK
jgi:serine protease Do